MTNLSMDFINNLEDKNHQLRQENSSLKDEISKQELMNTHLEITRKVRFYTGLPSFATLMIVLEFVSPYVSTSRALPKFQQFLMVLMKLRLNLADQDLVYRFGIYQSNVSRNFKEWIDVLYDRLRPLIIWPEPEQLLMTMPVEFRQEFPKMQSYI